MSKYINADCMEILPHIPDKYFDIAIVDPPYFSGPEKRRYYGSNRSTTNVARVYYQPMSNWHVPTAEYFDNLFRISKHQIIWGVNYYDYIFPSSGRIVWDKCNGKSTFSDCEIAYCSLHDSVRMFRYMWNGMMQGKSIDEGHIMQGNKKLNEKRIHPTQKPIMLYDWIIQKYVHDDWKIIDTHVGSASSLIACETHGIEYFGIEIDPEMYKLSLQRLVNFRKI